ncbi:multidrug efflux RND transporter permease subunit [Campylobacter sp. FMV-PI01]|uniref:Multidrug efflux RND transporter permease subunit n=1 Tax=Campylobacter portucalensis TaxID=2608384 RepID=A0A6L5WFS9_9BACT|nr:multidrug efflux RND transporter permease subunit [Campylobacter portucalensis]MSN95729.1 multidrug efflux RND transporter permease subunit [Campylobacter portucalensis]
MFSKFFINRPILAMVLSIIIIIAGLISMKILPVEEYPQLTPPKIAVVANYNGADAQTIASTVAAPLEEAINGVENMIYMQSTSSSSGEMSLNVFFKVGTDPQEALVNVNNRVKIAQASLPEEVKRIGVNAFEMSPNILEVLSFYDPEGKMDIVDLNNYVSVNIVDELKRIPGVGNAILIGSKDYAMRIWIKPDMLKKYNLTISEVISSIREQNSQYAAGKIGEQPTTSDNPYVYILKPEGRLKNAQEFENIILRSDDKGSMLKLKDVADVTIGSEKYVFDAFVNKSAMAPVLIMTQSDANALEVAELVNKKLVELSKNFPGTLTYDILYDTTTFVNISIQEVIKTFIEAMILVLVVMYMFLGNLRATIIPMLAVPVSIIGAFAGILIMGFSINMITLFAMILAIGIVVDDAIIVIENVERILEEKPNLSVKEATQKAVQEIFAPVISIVLVLSAVFVPVAFMDGFVGIIQKQFALTLVVSVCLSGFVALTLTPALCALMLKKDRTQPWWFVRKFNDFFDYSTNLYTKGVSKILRHTIPSLIVVGIMIYGIYTLMKVIPGGLVPNEDKGALMVINQLPSASSIELTKSHGKNLVDITMSEENVESAGLMAGYDLVAGTLRENSSIMFIKLKPWDERRTLEQSSFALANKFNAMFYGNRDGVSFVVNPPPISGLSATGGFELFAQTNTGKSYIQMQEDMQKVVAAANQRPELMMVRTTLDTKFPQYNLVINDEKVKMSGVHLADLFATINATIGSYYVNDFNMLGKTYKVSIRAKSEFRDSENVFRNIFVKSQTTKNMIPINSLVKLERSLGPDNVDRFNGFPAAKVMGEPRPGYTSGQAIQAISEVFREVFPNNDYLIGWSGTAYQEVNSTGTGKIAFIFGLIFVYLILAAQYERWLMPLAVLTAVPFSVFGALIFIWARGLNNDIYFQIGLLLLIGLGAKNAILIIEFAMEEYKKGEGIFNASIKAARLRFRPIVMTSLAFTLGVLPMAISTGAGSASRQAIGTGVIGGMIAASTIAIFFVPLFYSIVENFNNWLNKKFKDNQLSQNKKEDYA